MCELVMNVRVVTFFETQIDDGKMTGRSRFVKSVSFDFD